MDFAKSLSQPNSGRRSFLWKAGAAMSAAVAAAVPGVAKSGTNQGDGQNAEVNRLAHQLGILEDEKTIRTLHQAYESRLDQGMYEDVVNMFTANAEVVYNGGLFAGQYSLRRLYCNLLPSGLTGKKMAPAPGFEPDPAQQQDIVEVAADRKTASGQFPYSIQVGAPMTGDSSLVEMARLQGEGIAKWWEGGTCKASYVKVDNAWKISRLEYRVISKADYKPGRTHANPIDVPAFSTVFPANPIGPDRLV
jgi:hypothetical protein